MTSNDIVVGAGADIPASLESALLTFLEPKVIAKAKEKGAKFKLIVTSPWPKQSPVKKEKVVVDESYISRLKGLAHDEARLELEIETLSGPSILEVASLLHVPMSKSSKVRSLRAQLFKTLRSEIVWRSIAGHDPERSEARVAEEP